MNDAIAISLKIIFLLGFTLHNIEEAIWLPKWSKLASKFHKPVASNQFIFAVIIVTMIGYLLTLFDILLGDNSIFYRYIYLGFVGMMGLNVIMPHLAGSIILKKYSPGLVTGLFLNLPISLIIIARCISNGLNVYYIILSIVLISCVILFLLKYLFILGDRLINQ